MKATIIGTTALVLAFVLVVYGLYLGHDGVMLSTTVAAFVGVGAAAIGGQVIGKIRVQHVLTALQKLADAAKDTER